MKNNQNISINSTIVILSFLLARYSKFFFAIMVGIENWESLDDNIAYSLILLFGLITGLVLTIFLTGKLSLEPLGLKINLLKDLGYGILYTIPMFLGFLFIFRFIYILDLSTYYKFLVVAGFGEELLFRGILFGLLFKYCSWGFIPACIISGLFFGAGHLYQATDLASLIDIFTFTFFANAGFAFFYYVWGSLWMIISLHGFMDVVWAMFPLNAEFESNAYIPLFRFSTLIIAILVTTRKFRRQDNGMLSTKLWVNRAEIINS